MRDLDTIDNELSVLARMHHRARGGDSRPTAVAIDRLLDERNEVKNLGAIPDRVLAGQTSG